MIFPQGLLGIGEHAFFGCVALEDLQLPDEILYIEMGAFSDCISLTTVTVPDSIHSMGPSVFRGCPELKEINFPDIKRRSLIYPWYQSCLANIKYYQTERGDDRFEATEKEDYLTIPNDGGFTVASIKNLHSQKAIIPEGATRIGKYAFSNCPYLTQITIPKSVLYIDEEAFSDCSKLEEITVHKENTSFCSVDGVLFSKKRKKLLRYHMAKFGDFTVPSTVTKIAPNAFHGCHGLCSVTVSLNLGTLNENMFKNCPRLNANNIIRK